MSSLSRSWRAALLRRAAPWAVPALLVLAWQWSATHGMLGNNILPAPLAVLRSAWKLAINGELWTHLGTSFLRAAAGFMVGASLGLLLGLATGLSRTGEMLFDSTLQMLRNVPVLAMVPLVILWFGIDEGAKLFLVAFSTLFPVYLNTYHGIKSVDPALIEMGRSYGLGRWGLLREIILPGATSSILVGVRYALGVAWIVLIIAETISASAGIGYLALNAREFLQTDIIVLSIILYALLGKLTDWLARLLERRWLRWHPSYNQTDR